ncbi:hypothetical protein J6W34_08760, partial [bacterium]|nr:hypothetical protein [bacterium]
MLNQIINVGSIDNMSSYTAADALNDEASNNLKQAVIEAIENEISSSISKFTFNSLTYTAKEIGNGIDVSLPN